MSLTTRVGLFAGAAALTLSGVGNVYAANETAGNDDMAQRLAAAEAKIAAMEAASNTNWLTEQRAAEIRGLVHDVLADADTRASLLQTGMTAGYDNGAVIGSADGNNLLRTNILLQPRFIWNSRDADTEENRYGFELTRAKVIFTGHVVDPSWYYRLDVNYGNNGTSGREDLGNGYVGKDFGNGLWMQMGSMKAPFMREELVEAQNQLAIERSTVNYLFTTGYADGLQVGWDGDQFRIRGMFSDGFSTGNTVWAAPDTDFALTGRVEWLASGNWDQFDQFTSPKGGETGIMVGGAAHYQQGEEDTFADDTEILALTADVSAQFGGWNLFGAFNWNDNSFGGGVDDVNPWGLVVQGGVYLNDTWELYGRYEFTDFDVDGAEDLNLLTVGVNKYFAGQNVKWSADVGFAFDEVQLSSNITGLRADDPDDDGQFIVRTQWQLLF
jgi:hypothetical protein